MTLVYDTGALLAAERAIGPCGRCIVAVLHVLGEFERADEVFKQGESTQSE